MSITEDHANQARQLVALGYPGIEGRLPEALTWLQDANCSAFAIIEDFLVVLGKPVVPHVRKVLSGTDTQWKYWVIGGLISRWPKEIVEELTSELESVSLWEDDSGADLEAVKVLIKHRLSDSEKLRNRVRQKKQACTYRLEDLKEIERSLEVEGWASRRA